MYNYTTKGKVITFGEVFLMASSTDLLKIQQSETLSISFKGAELTVAASLSNFGLEVSHVSSVSKDFLGEAAIAFIKRNGVDVKYVSLSDDPLGFYIMEPGSGIRPSKIANTEIKNAFQGINREYIDWDKVFKNSSTFYWTFSTVISGEVVETLKKGLEKANASHISIIADASTKSDIKNNYFKSHAADIKQLVKQSDIFIGGPAEISLLLGTDFLSDRDGFIEACKALTAKYPNIIKIFDKVSDEIQCYGRGWAANNYIETNPIALGNVLDTHGISGAFAAGLIYALRYYDYEQSLNFANAAFAIKHSIVGDFNVSTVSEVVDVLQVSNSYYYKN